MKEGKKERRTEVRINVGFGKVFTDSLIEQHSPIKI